MAKIEVGKNLVSYFVTVRIGGSKNDPGPIGRSARVGRRVKIGGREFFTTDEERVPEEDLNLVDAVTGCHVGCLGFVAEHLAELEERLQTYGRVDKLPLAEFRNGVYVKAKGAGT